MNEKRFVDHDTSVEDYLESRENKNTKEKTKRDVKLLETFWSFTVYAPEGTVTPGGGTCASIGILLGPEVNQ